MNHEQALAFAGQTAAHQHDLIAIRPSNPTTRRCAPHSPLERTGPECYIETRDPVVGRPLNLSFGAPGTVPVSPNVMQLQGRRTFLARPFWRDYVIAYVLIGLGWMLTSPVAPVHPAIGIVILAWGAATFLCAVGWSIRSTWRSWRSR